MFDVPPLTEVAVAACAATAVAAATMVDHRLTRQPLLLWGAISAVVLVGLREAPSWLLAGVAAQLGAAAIIDRRARLATSAGAMLVVVAALTDGIQTPLRMGALGAGGVAGLLLWRSYVRFGQRVAVVLITGTAVGIYINVPDTEQIVVHAAGLLVLAMAMIMFRRISTMPVGFGACVLIGFLVMSAGATGARGRPDAFIGVIGALGVLVAEPVASLVRRGTKAHPVLLVVVHAVVVVVASRIAGPREASYAVPVVIATMFAGLVLLVALPRRPLADSED